VSGKDYSDVVLLPATVRSVRYERSGVSGKDYSDVVLLPATVRNVRYEPFRVQAGIETTGGSQQVEHHWDAFVRCVLRLCGEPPMSEGCFVGAKRCTNSGHNLP
jgi:hypothetical protein